MIRVVLDTNVYLSGIIFGGKPKTILTLTRRSQLKNYTSPKILLELSQKLQQKFLWSTQDIQNVMKAISMSSTLVKPTISLSVVHEDSTDNKILECAETAKADFVITGDKHLLNLKKWKSTEIVTPSEFIVRILSL